ncbi:hypothetical protein SLEP1_g24180 [Rubroshorea leprosula]|uniref:Uncharacterized protein n=1 Tax=Rubroshorea leprosula TaxID=152421 RepID=A0AAV5JP39_9ROSI|nr:hypothetical protein SLEP1_g24180 [Rubroshorea leprosula]
MGRAPCCSKVGLHKGPWTPREDTLLVKYIQNHGEGHWRSLPKKAGLLRCGKSCRLRWMNYLRPDIKRGNISADEDDLIIRLHSLLGNRWSLIAGRLPGRTDNEIKNYWNTHLSKKLISEGTDPITHKKLSQPVLQEVKKRSGRNAKTSSKRQANKNKAKVEPDKPKIHLPKPVRAKSFSLPRDHRLQCNNLSTAAASTSHSKGAGGLGTDNVVLVPWSDDVVRDDGHVEGTGFLEGYNDHDHHDHHQLVINGSDLECHSNLLPTSDGSLEKLYEEYLQLLRTNEDQVHLDSFAESLLI